MVAVSREAAARGVRPGMPLAEARALLPAEKDRLSSIVFHRWEPTKDQAALETLRQRCLRFSPIVTFGYDSPVQSLLLDMSGCERLFGGEEAMVRRIAETFVRWGYWARIALADTPRAAYALARYHRPASVEDLPLDVLRTGSVHSDTLPRPRRLASGDAEAEWVIARAGHTLQAVRHLPPHALGLPDSVTQQLLSLGIHSLRSLIGIPRYALQERFGAVLLERLDQMFGLKEDRLRPPKEKPHLCELWQFDMACDDASLVRYVVERLLARLVRAAIQRSHSIARIMLTIYFESGSDHLIPITLFHPTTSFEHLKSLIDLQLEQLMLSERVEAIRLESDELVSQPPKQHTLFAGICDDTNSDRWAMLVERLVHRLGGDRVLRVIDLPDAQPEHAVRLIPMLSAALRRPHRHAASQARRLRRAGDNDTRASPTTMLAAVARPLRLLKQPEQLIVTLSTVQGFPVKFRGYGRSWTAHRFSEPERIETGWWRSQRTVRRDYYRVETTDGTHLWLFRDLNDGHWYLHGIFE